MESRICTKCNEPRLFSQFYANSKKVCKFCVAAKSKDYYHENKNKPKKAELDSREQSISLARLARKNLKNRVKKKNPDREIYIHDQFFEPKYFIEFGILKNIPLEQLDAEFYRTEETIDEECLRLSAEFLKREKTYRTLTTYERKTR